MAEPVEMFFDFVLIKRDDEQRVTSVGIHLPEYSTKLATYGLVVAIGPGKYTKQGIFIETKVRVGDRVCFPCGAGYKTNINGEEYLSMQERDLWARERRLEEVRSNPADVASLPNAKYDFNLIALWDKLIVKPAAPETMIGLIHLPDQAIKKPRRGKALSVGGGIVDEEGRATPIDVQVGEGVRYKDYAGMEIEFQNEEYIIISDLDVITKEEEVPA